MSSAEPVVDLEQLLAHAGWVRSLARRLVHDPDRAADVEHDSWVTVLRHPPRDARNLKGWLARVVRSAAVRSARSGARRAARERNVARGEALPATDDVVSDAERQRRLADVVLALDEPYRSVVLLRYFQGKRPAAIAQQLGTPLETVRSQLRRGVDRLRERLDREHGDRATWVALLAPLAAGPGLEASTAKATGLGRLWMRTKVRAGAAAALVAAAVSIGVWQLAPDRSGAEAPPLAVPGVAARGADGAGAAGPAPGPVRRPHDPPSAATAEPPPAPAPELRLEGRAVDLAARPLAGVELALRASAGAERETAVSDRDGRFELDLPLRAPRLEVLDDDRVAVATGWLEGELWVLVAPALPMEGTVVDEEERPVAGASVRVVANAMSLRDFTRTPRWEEPFRWFETETDERGRYRLPRVPLVADRREADTFVAKPGYATAHPALPRERGERVDVVLRSSPDEAPLRVVGIVRAPTGTPIAGAEVVYGKRRALTERGGRFDLHLDQIYADMPLCALHADYTPGALERLDALLPEGGGGTTGVTLFLGAAPLAIEGVVRHRDGRPATDYRVTLQEGTPLGATGEWAELRGLGLAAGPAATGSEIEDGSVRVGADGSFRLDGLTDRTYALRVWHPDHGVVLVSAPVPAGAVDAELWIEDDALGRLAAVAVDRSGSPVAGLEVQLTFQDLPSVYRGWRRVPRSVTTDADGRFELDGVPRDHARLAFAGPHVVSTPVPVPPHAPGQTVTLTVPMQTRFRIELAPGDPADAFEVLDAHGAVQRLSEYHSWGSIVRSRIELGAGGFPVCVSHGDAATVVLYAGDREVRRAPLSLPTGGVHVVRL